MANTGLFRSIWGNLLAATDTRNDEGAPAYAFDPRHALAQYATTGCLHTTFYATDAEQLDRVLALCAQVEPEFIARTAIYARERGFMKDMPALLCAVLSCRAPALLERVFPRVVDSGRMLRTFVQIVRSGAVGRKSLGSLPKRLVRRWLAERSDEAVFAASVGRSPSMADIVRMVHPRPATASREALYGWLLGRPYDPAALPKLVRGYEAYKAGETTELPAVPFQMLTQLPLGAREWARIAERAGWQATRMNLNTFARHGVFAREGVTETITGRLADGEAIRLARAFPYQLLAAWASVDEAVPAAVRRALEDAMEIAINNVPAVAGRVVVCPDVSGSMWSPVTGVRRGATTAVRCVDVAALVAAAVLRRSPDTMVLPFEHRVIDVRLSPRDSVLTNAAALARVGGGGTSCSAPLARLNQGRERVDLVILVSDNESWVDAGQSRGTATLREWNRLRRRNPGARLVCIDVQPYGTTQAVERADILNVGGFSDQVFEVVAEFAAGRLTSDHWVGAIEAVAL
jgi:60 kDa SS-A/Ro ribonucleoprotein